MSHLDSLVNADWQRTVAALGGEAYLEATARETRAFLRRRGVRSAPDLIRLVLAYCLGDRGLRLTAAWAAAIGLADISNVALLGRLRQCDVWLERLVGHLLAKAAAPMGKGRLIRLVDGTTVPKAERAARRRSGLWRIHASFDLPAERFSHFTLTDESGGERLDRIPVIPGEIRIADAGFLQPERIGCVLSQGADVVVRAAWRNGRWLDAKGEALDLLAMFKAASTSRIDRHVLLCRTGGEPIPLRFIAAKLPPEAAEAARRRARREAQKRGSTVSDAALAAAEWVVLATSLGAAEFSADDVLSLYRLRWRVELAFKRLKSVVGLQGPPGTDARSARAFVLAHLLMILLLEPEVTGFENSPHWAIAA